MRAYEIMRIRLAILVATVAGSVALAQGSMDLPVLSALKLAAPSLGDSSVWHRQTMSDGLELVLAVEAPKEEFTGRLEKWFWWQEGRRLGIFLQDRGQPTRVFAIAVKARELECSARILRATEFDTVISCDGEKSERYPNQKFVYDLRAKRLVSDFTYDPFAFIGIDPGRDARRAILVATDHRRRVDVEFNADAEPKFRIHAVTAQVPPEPAVRAVPPSFGPRRAFRIDLLARNSIVGPDGTYELPSTTFATFAAARPERVKNGYGPESKFEEVIGPSTLEGDNLWFGKSFYDGEGSTGVGGFGYFDPIHKTFRLFTHRSVGACSVSAIDVHKTAVWLALVYHGEWGDSGCGVVRFDRDSQTYEEFSITGIGQEFAQIGEQLLLATDRGITVLERNDVIEYFIDRTTDGRLRVVPSN